MVSFETSSTAKSNCPGATTAFGDVHFPGGQCRRESVCFTGIPNIGAPVLTTTINPCTGAATITVNNCDPTSSITYTYSWGGNSYPKSGSDKCSYSAVFPSGDTVVTVASSAGGCSGGSTTTTISVPTPISLSLGAFQKTDCAGNGYITATPAGGSGSYTLFEWRVDTNPFTSGNPTFYITPMLDGQCHTITARVTDSNGCTANAAQPVLINQCVVTTSPC